MVGYNMDGPARDQVMKLIHEKDRIESEIRDQNLVLQANNVGMQDPLVDEEGYPRNDIDVYKVRHARHRIICLQNDHKNIMKQIERGLGEVHSPFLEHGEGTSRGHHPQNAGYANGFASATSNNGDTSENRHIECFAIIGFVQEGSPADLGGLCENDEVLQFGSVNHSNFTDVTQILNIVSHSVGQPIQVCVRRNMHVFGISLIPRPWAQPGLLGCQIRRKT